MEILSNSEVAQMVANHDRQKRIDLEKDLEKLKFTVLELMTRVMVLEAEQRKDAD